MKKSNLFNQLTTKLLTVFTLVVMLTMTIGCGDDDEPTPPQLDDIVTLASGNGDLSILVEALTKFPDLVTTLSGNGSFTVFAPNDDAFTALLSAIGQDDLDDIPEDVLRRVLEYHVIAGAALRSTDLTDGQTAATVLGENVTVGISGTTVTINSSQVVGANVEADNGIVHVINSVLIPNLEGQIVGTIVAPAYFNKDFTTLIAAVNAADADILSVLLGNGPSGNGLTLFAPTNAAFEAAGITTLPDAATLTAVLQYHVLDDEVTAMELPSGSATIESLNGDFYLSNNGANGVFINGTTEVTTTDVQGSNGVVHIIDRTLLPPSQTIAEIVTDLTNGTPAEFTQLLAAVARTDGEATDLLAAISNPGDLTVFAPTDAAFQALLDTNPDWDTVDDIEIGLLTAVLQHHVVGARVFSTDLSDGMVGTLNQNITIDATNLQISDAAGSDPANINASLVNILGTNGVIHVIDRVLLPAD
ncbi:MAG: fasciclin domain-containing protein [Bacteroidota bacterium]